eukprot:s3729_g3.t2
MAMENRHGKRRQKALWFFAILGEHRLSPNAISYSNSISACARAEEWPKSLQLFSEALQQNRPGGVLDVTLYNALLSACEKAAEWQRALLLFFEMDLHDLQADAISYNTVISSCETAKKWEEALLLLGDLEQQQMQANRITFNSAMSTCEKASCWISAHRLFLMMYESHLEPDRISFNVAMAACQGPHAWKAALSLFGTATVASLEPNAISLSCLAGVLGSAAQWKKVLELIDGPWRPNVISFNASLRAATWHRWTAALHLVCREDKDSDGLRLNVITGNTLLSHLDGQWRRAVHSPSKIPHSTWARHALPRITYNSTITNCHRHGHWEVALEILDVSSKDSLPNVITYSAVASACDVALKWRATALLLNAAATRRVGVLNSILHNVAISSCERSTQWEHALHAFEQLENSTASDTADLTSCNIAISVCEKSAQWREALAWLERIDELRLKPDVVTMTSAIGACAKMKQWQQVLALFARAVDRSLRCNVLSFASGCEALEPGAALRLLQGLEDTVAQLLLL